MSNVIEIFFNGKKELLEILNTGGDIVNHVLQQNKICPLLRKEISLTEKLGKGNFGTVFLIDFPGKGPKMYAAKRNKVEVEAAYFRTTKSYETTFNEMVKSRKILQPNFSIDKTQFFKFNKIDDPNLNPPKDITLYYPTFLVNPCQKNKKFKRTDGNGETIVPPGSLICQNSITEIILSLMAAELSKDSINFIDTFYFATCTSNSYNVRQYTFMEKIDTSFEKLIGKKAGLDPKPPVYGKAPTEKEVISIYLQTVHALLVLQNRFSIVHGDLHLDNVFIEKLKDSTESQGSLVKNSDFLEFKILEGSSLYIPTIDTPYLAKIGDWGLSVKYPTKEHNVTIGDETVFEDGYDQKGGEGPWLPNFYSKAYDVAYFTARLHYTIPGNVFIRRIIMWILGFDPDTPPDENTLQKFLKVFMKSTGYRPNIKEGVLTSVLSHVSPLSILTNTSLMGEYLRTPVGRILEVSSNEKIVEYTGSPPKIVSRARFTKPKIEGSVIRSSKYIERIQRNSASPKGNSITSKMRNITVEWMCDVADDSKATERDFISSVAILDFYLSFVKVQRQNLQTAACVAMNLAFGEKRDQNYFESLDKSCSVEKQNKMKASFLKVFEEQKESYEDLPNTVDFLNIYKNEKLLPSSGKVYSYALYALYVAASEEKMLDYSVEQIAACSVILGKTMSARARVEPLENIEKITGLSLVELKPCLEDLGRFCTNTTQLKNKSDIYRKFDDRGHFYVSSEILNIADILSKM
jgi:hypothetical protein